MKLSSLLPFLLFILFFQGSSAQELYRTLNGSIEIRGETDSGAIKAQSSELFMRVEHETGDVFMKLEQSSLSSGIDSIDQRLDSLPEGPITFEGALKRGGFDPNHCYSPTPLRIDGTLKYGTNEWDVQAKGEFKSRISGDRIPCVLEIGMRIDIGEADIPGFLPGFKKNVRIFILQALLNPQM